MRLAAIVEFGVHAELFGDRRETFLQRGKRDAFFGNEADAREELAGVEIVELRTVDDVAALLGEIAAIAATIPRVDLHETVNT